MFLSHLKFRSHIGKDRSYIHEAVNLRRKTRSTQLLVPRHEISISSLEWFRSNNLPFEERSLTKTQDNDTNMATSNNYYTPSQIKPAKNSDNSLEYLRSVLKNTTNSVFRRHVKNELPDSVMAQQNTKQDSSKKKVSSRSKKKISNKRVRSLIKRKEISLTDIDGEEYLECCPSKIIVVEKQVGKDRNNHAVEVNPSQKYFYERVCHDDVKNKECLFASKAINKKLNTRCVQQFSYVQALVRPYRTKLNWRLDYIHVQSGCSCHIGIARKKKKAKL